MKMGDSVEAGKYFFLSGERGGALTEPIKLYVSRYTKKGYSQLYATFPDKAKLNGLEGYPEVTRTELQNMGMPKKWQKRCHPEVPPETLMDRILGCLGIGVFIFIVICFFVGLVGIVWKFVAFLLD